MTIATNEVIRLEGVRTHNLQGISVSIPKGTLTVITGPSGSGKSSLAFDTLYAEGQRRYVESLSAYTRQFLERMDRPDVDTIHGIPPAIAVERKPPARTSRSTVGTTTEILDYLRMLYARTAILRCLGCGRDVMRTTTPDNVDALLRDHAGKRVTIVFPPGETTAATGESLRARGFHRVTRDGRALTDLHDHDPFGGAGLTTDRDAAEDTDVRAGADGNVDTADARGEWRVVADRLRLDADARGRLQESLEVAFHEGSDRAGAFVEGAGYVPLSRGLHCASCDRAYADPTPLTFSFNSPAGACPACRGFGDVIDLDPGRVVPDGEKSLQAGAVAPFGSKKGETWQRKLEAMAPELGVRLDVPWQDLTDDERRTVYEGSGKWKGVRGFFAALERKIYKLHVRVFLSRYRRYVPCETCGGTRLRPETLAYHLDGRSIADVCRLPADQALAFARTLDLPGMRGNTAQALLPEIERRLAVMVRAGLGYLSLERPSRTLSGGEYQRILLAGALGSGLVGTLYVLDEPSVGLHAKDGERLLEILHELRDAGNTVVVVEHDRDLIAGADHLIDLGPGAGEHGGRITFEGSPSELEAAGPGTEESATAAYLSRREDLPPVVRRTLDPSRSIGVRGARGHNLQDIDVDIPLGGLVCVTGVSGSGKSTLVQDTLHNAYRVARGDSAEDVQPHTRLVGLAKIQDMVLVDQSPIGRTPRSNPVTYVKAFDGIRKLFAGTRDARRLGLEPGHFSFNVAGGRCETCEGAGHLKIELQFLADLYVVCDGCDGKRYQDRILDVRYRTRSIHDVLQMTVTEAVRFFADTRAVSKPLWQLDQVGLGYLRLGQPATTLSGGEAQRLKIALHLAREVKGESLFILDEPTTGLHLRDVGKLLKSFERLLGRGHTVLVVEHNLDVIARADWIIDLGPGGGIDGGQLVVAGPPATVARTPDSITGHHLAAHLARWGHPATKDAEPVARRKVTRGKASPRRRSPRG